MRRVDELLAEARSVAIATVDQYGRLMGKKRPAADWPRLAAEGLAMPDFHLVTSAENRPLPAMAAGGAQHGFRNGTLKPDREAAFPDPGDPGTVIVLADALRQDGRPAEEAPRRILARQIERLTRIGIVATAASELEFYLLRQSYQAVAAEDYRVFEPFYHRAGDNDLLVAARATPFVRMLETHLVAAGIAVDQVQGEGGTGQIEINIAPRPALCAADDHAAFKYIVKACAAQMDMAATFMAKPFQQEAGSGGHIHLSLADEQGRSALGERSTLSPLGRAFIAGIVELTGELTLLHAPFCNSYRRLIPGNYTPLVASWGFDNRTAMVRVVAGRTLRFELRLPGADANSYLSYAALLAAGIAGVERGLELAPEKQGDAEEPGAPRLPADLTEAIAAFAGSALAEAAFGTEVKAHLVGHAAAELAATRAAVTTWEIARGFEIA